jgi:Putative Flp pilus-assembly TadE/G-like
MRGQALAIFALSLTAVLGAGALAFDGGLLILERRDQQNAADAAAMAGARFVTSDKVEARRVASLIAADNGFVNGSGSQVVQVNVPPTTGQFATWPNAIQVKIKNTRPSILAAVMGILNWDVSANATAASLDQVGGPFSILSLAPHECAAVNVQGSGSIVANGNIQVNSDCATSALKRQAGGTITVTASGAACNVKGGIQNGGGSGTLNCNPVTGAPIIPDPLSGLPGVLSSNLTTPTTPVEIVGSKQIPSGCPGGSSAATLSTPSTCQFQSSYKNTVWRLYPGLYPGGIKLQGGTFYLEPGIYWLGGGGLDITGNETFTTSVDAGTTTYGGGVMFYNTGLPNSTIAPITLNGSSANIHLLPLAQPSTSSLATWNGLVIYQDRNFAIGGDDVTVNGNDSVGLDVRGTMYLPQGDVKVNGNNGDLVIDQVIAWTFFASGNGGDILALKENDYLYKFTAAGLVE